MGILLAFAPFIIFALVDRLLGPTLGLAVGALVAAVLLARDWMTPGRTPKILEIGTTLLFGGLALYGALGRPEWSILEVRLRVDAGLFMIVLVSMMVRRPFTLQYAREQVPSEFWGQPEFIRVNTVITAVWAAAFAVMVIADFALLFDPKLPPLVGITATIVALVGAIKFTAWYPDRARAKSAAL